MSEAPEKEAMEITVADLPMEFRVSSYFTIVYSTTAVCYKPRQEQIVITKELQERFFFRPEHCKSTNRNVIMMMVVMVRTEVESFDTKAHRQPLPPRKYT